MRVRTVEIEFLEDTFREDGTVARDKGDRLFVDKMSAHSFVDVKKVAKRVGDGPTLSTSKRVPKRAPVVAEGDTGEPVDGD